MVSRYPGRSSRWWSRPEQLGWRFELAGGNLHLMECILMIHDKTTTGPA